MKGLDLRKFKKLHSNEETTTLAHPDGHTIKIAHQKLKPEHREQLNKLPKFAEGGFVDKIVHNVQTAFDQPEPRKKLTNAAPADPTAQQSSDMSKTFGKTKPKFANGGEVDDLGMNTDVMSMSPMAFENLKTESTPQERAASFIHKDSDNLSGIMTSPAEMQQAGAFQPNAADATPASVPQNNLQSLGAPSQINASIPMVDQGAPTAMGGYNQQVQGIQNEAAGQQQLNNANADIYQKQNQDLQAEQQDYKQHFNELNSEVSAIASDLKAGHLDPQHFWNSMSDTGKVMTTIGLALGGLGEGLGAGANPAMKMLNAQIDRDIDAQKTEMNKKSNLMSHLYHQMGNLKDASQMARATMAEIYGNKIKEVAAKYNNPIIAGRAQQMIGQLAQQVAPGMQEVAMKRSILQGMQNGTVSPAQAVGVVVPKEEREPVFKELERAQNAVHHESNIMKNFDAAAKNNTIIQRTGRLGAEPPELTNVRNLLMPVLKDNEGRINETEIKMMEDFLPKAGDKDSKIAVKRKGLEEFIRAKQSAPRAEAYGIKLPKPSSTNKMK